MTVFKLFSTLRSDHVRVTGRSAKNILWCDLIFKILLSRNYLLNKSLPFLALNESWGILRRKPIGYQIYFQFPSRTVNFVTTNRRIGILFTAGRMVRF